MDTRFPSIRTRPNRSGLTRLLSPDSDPAGEARAEFGDVDATRWRALLQALPGAVWVTDSAGRCVTPQQAWSAYTGQSLSAQMGLGWLEAVHEGDRETWLKALAQARACGRQFRSSGRIWHASSRCYRHFEASGVAVRDANSEIREWVGLCTDVEDARRAEEALREADQRKHELIAVVAHELRNPLAPIRNAAHLLRSHEQGDTRLGWARSIIERQVGQMNHLLDDLLDLSRIRQDKVVLRKVRTTLSAIIEAAIETSRPLMEQQEHRFELDMPSSPIHVEADPVRLCQVFTNLLNNAAKYTDRGGRITMTVQAREDEARISITDCGIGIAPAMLPRLFQLFSQVTPAPERAQGGLGIGLALVKAFVEMHAGSVEVSSDGVGRGSEFVVRLPIAGRVGAATGFTAAGLDPSPVPRTFLA